MKYRRVTGILLGVGLGVSSVAWGQTLPEAKAEAAAAGVAGGSMVPAFDVATVKSAPAGQDGSSGIQTQTGEIHAKNVTLLRCLMGAYGVGPHEVTGGPAWVKTERFDIEAKGDPSIKDDATLMLMLRGLLAERFKLVLHREVKATSALVIEVAKNGPKLEPAQTGEAATSTNNNGVSITVDARHTDLNSFAKILARRMDLPVVNKTGLDGFYDLKLHWTPESRRQESPAATDEISIYTAMEEQLGLKLRVMKSPVEMLMIDGVEQPSAN